MTNQDSGIVNGGNNANSGNKNRVSASDAVKLCINFVSHLLILIVVIYCLYYACSSEKIGTFQLHIIFSVLGYQFLMCQGTLVLNPSNIWSKFFLRKTNKNLHMVLQIVAVVFVITGSFMMYMNHFNFESAHGIFACLALTTSLFSLINGFQNFYRYFHYYTGIITLYLSAISLCFGLNVSSVKKWAGDEEAVPYLLMAFTIIFTTLIALDFFIVTKNMITNYFKRNK